MSITSDYIDFCLSLKYEELPSQLVSYTKRLCLDFVSTAAYGTLADSSKTMLHFIDSFSTSGDCTVIGASTKYAQEYAAHLFSFYFLIPRFQPGD